MILKDLLIGLQFLTRIRIAKQTEWSAEGFGRSVKYFPLVGGVIGSILAGLFYVVDTYAGSTVGYLPPHIFAALMVALPIWLTGGLHCDGFMDAMDGLLSGKNKDKMLEIMKDSRVGAHGVTAFVLLILFKWSLFMDIDPAVMPTALFIMPVLGRFAMVMGITAYPYARPDGIGKAFAQFASRSSLYIALLFTLVLIIPWGAKATVAALVAVVCCMLFAGYANKVLGGLTGDLYGAISECIEVAVLLAFLY